MTEEVVCMGLFVRGSSVGRNSFVRLFCVGMGEGRLSGLIRGDCVWRKKIAKKREAGGELFKKPKGNNGTE